MNGFRDLEFLIEPVHTAVELCVVQKREKMAREALKHDGEVAAQAVLTNTRDHRKEAGSNSQDCCKRIPKTIVYIDSIKQIMKAVKALTVLLIQAGCSRASAVDAVQAYHSELAESDKRRISAEFAKPDAESILDSSIHRIIVATDAMGMGIDNPDIQLVIQWGVPPSMHALMQRAGRAARGKGVCGKFLWLVQPWCFGERIEHLPLRSTNKRMTERERRSVLPRGMWELINRSVCIRRGILEFFGEDCTSYSRPADAEACCGRCAGDKIRIRIGKAGRPVRTVQSQKHIVEAVKLALVEWRKAKEAVVLSATLFKGERVEQILPDKAVTAISRTAGTINSMSSLAYAVNREWGNLALYEKEVLDTIQIACLQAALKKQKL
jgi:hypothetical protein